MPYELGIDMGCRLFGSAPLSAKRALVLESEPFRYRQALSDLSGSDIAAHGDHPREVVVQVRNWLESQCHLNAPGPELIWNRFNEFEAENYDDLIDRGFSARDIERLAIPDLIAAMKEWISKQ